MLTAGVLGMLGMSEKLPGDEICIRDYRLRLEDDFHWRFVDIGEGRDSNPMLNADDGGTQTPD